MRILITGANGFLGSHVAERLQEQGHDLRLMLRRTSNISFLSEVQSYERVNADLRHAASLSSVAKGVDTVLHMGGVTLARTENEYQEANGTGTANLVTAAVKAGVRRFVYVSSLAAHGPSTTPQPRPLDAPGAPVTAYGRSKLSGEYAVQAQQQHFQTVILRPPAVYGPRDKALLPLYRAGKLGIFPLLGDGTNLASFVYVDDAVDAILRATISETPPSAVYTFEDGQPHTWRALVDAFSRASGRKVHVIPTPQWLYTAAGYAGGLAGIAIRKPLSLNPEKVTHISQRYWVCNSDAITRDLGWQPRVGLEEGMSRTLDWYKRHRWL